MFVTCQLTPTRPLIIIFVAFVSISVIVSTSYLKCLHLKVVGCHFTPLLVFHYVSTYFLILRNDSSPSTSYLFLYFAHKHLFIFHTIRSHFLCLSPFYSLHFYIYFIFLIISFHSAHLFQQMYSNSLTSSLFISLYSSLCILGHLTLLGSRSSIQ